MANKHRDINTDELIELAHKYIDECEIASKEVATGKGVQSIKERKLPTIKYWVVQWLKKQGYDFYTREHVYAALADEAHPLSYTLKKIRSAFDSVAEDIVANEGKGIFYAKNRLGMTDKMDTKQDGIQKIIIERNSKDTTTE